MEKITELNIETTTVETTPVKVVDEKLFNEIKRTFRAYFEGSPSFDELWDGCPPLSGDEPVSVEKFGIHLLELDGKTLVISLSRPGYLIGKGGRLIKAFTEYLQKHIDSEIKINLKEFDPFKCNYNGK